MAEGIPEHVHRMGAAARVRWLDSEEACRLLGKIERRRLGKLWRRQAASEPRASNGTPSYVMADPASERVAREHAAVRDEAERRRAAIRGTEHGAAPCGCAYCVSQQPKHGLWPAHYVDARPRSYECHLERNPPPADEDHPHASLGGRISKEEAASVGLRERDPSRRSIWASLVQSRCEGCGGTRPAGSRFCPGCRSAYSVILAAAGRPPEWVEAFLSPKRQI